MEKWYVAHSKPRNEELLSKQFYLRNIESYFPCIKVQTINPRARKVKPYFPGYLFIHVDLELVPKSILEWIPGGNGLVSFGGEPAFVHDSLISEIKQRINSLKMGIQENHIPYCKGDNIGIHSGFFKGYEGIFNVELSGSDRVQVLLSMLGNRLIPVEMSISCIHLIS